LKWIGSGTGLVITWERIMITDLFECLMDSLEASSDVGDGEADASQRDVDGLDADEFGELEVV